LGVGAPRRLSDKAEIGRFRETSPQVRALRLSAKRLCPTVS
jgi:hypothetical protein